MNNLVTLVTKLLLKEYPNGRKSLYGLAALAGPVLAILQSMGWKHLGPLPMDTVAQWFPAAALPVAGGIAFANVKKPEDQDADLGHDWYGDDYDDDYDADSFGGGSSEHMSFS